MTISANKRLGYLEQGLVELERKFLKRIEDCQNTEGNEGEHLARAYLLLGLRELVKLFDGAKDSEYGEGDLRVHLRTNCDKLVGVGKDERIRMKLFIRILKGDALSWYISQDPKKWSNWVSMASSFLDRFRFNIENAPDVFYIQNLKKKPTETFRENATRWRSEAAKIQPSGDAEVNMSMPLKFEAPSSAKKPMPIEVEFMSPANASTPFEIAVLSPKDYTTEARRKGKVKFGEAVAAQGMTRTGRGYTLKHLAESSKQASGQPTITETRPDDLWRKIQAKEYSVIDQLNKMLA
ncbi:uncharacterized protein [Nicotiana sylvestris]|uniref:uncharacterized protein n=1 Tax=Nicotiana sylvestris TaxID=4096 RepID=UPI00388CDF2F